MTPDTAMRDVLSDLYRAAADDVGVHLSPLHEGRLLGRMVELAELAGIELVRPPTLLPLEYDDRS